jgi:uncharacterized membrane protein
MRILLTMRHAVAFFAAIGVGIMGYLTYLHYSGATSEVCELITGFSCELVNTSVYSELLGIPVAVLGGLYFIGILVLALHPKVRRRFELIVCATVFSLIFGIYLSILEWLVIEAICLFCELSKLTMLVILTLSLVGLRREKARLPRSWAVGAVAVGLLFSGAHYLIQREPPVQYDWSPVAQCLTDKGVFMYGSYTCPKCAKQKRLFGDAFAKISYVECDPRGQDQQTERCVNRDVVQVPTWIEEKDGQEVRRVVGVHKPEGLASFFGCLP